MLFTLDFVILDNLSKNERLGGSQSRFFLKTFFYHKHPIVLWKSPCFPFRCKLPWWWRTSCVCSRWCDGAPCIAEGDAGSERQPSRTKGEVPKVLFWMSCMWPEREWWFFLQHHILDLYWIQQIWQNCECGSASSIQLTCAEKNVKALHAFCVAAQLLKEANPSNWGIPHIEESHLLLHFRDLWQGSASCTCLP